MAVLTGDNFYLEFDGVGLFSDYREFDPGIEYDTAEGTSGGSTLRRHVVTKLKVEPTLTMVLDDDATGDSIAAVLQVGHIGNLVWGDYGNAPGMPRAGIRAQVVKANRPSTYDEEREIEVTFINLDDDWVYDPAVSVFPS